MKKLSRLIVLVEPDLLAKLHEIRETDNGQLAMGELVRRVLQRFVEEQEVAAT